MAYPTYYTGHPGVMPAPVVYGYQPAPQGQLEQLRAAQAYQAQAAATAPAMQAMQAPQSSGTGIPWVQGEAGAKAYLVAPGSSVLLMDSEAQSFYIKSADGSGMPLPLRIFDYTERQATPAQTVPPAAQPTQAPTAPAANYATREELDALIRRLDELERQKPAAPVRQEVTDTDNGKGGPNHGKRSVPAT